MFAVFSENSAQATRILGQGDVGLSEEPREAGPRVFFVNPPLLQGFETGWGSLDTWSH